MALEKGSPTKHKISPRKRCGECNEIFFDELHLKYHRKSHQRPYKCKICEKAYTKEDSLKHHIQTHNVEKPFQCSQCGKAFSFMSSLSIHVRIHNKKRSHQCNHCNEAFLNKRDLLSHINIDQCEFNYKNCYGTGQVSSKELDSGAFNSEYATDQANHIVNVLINQVKDEQMESETNSLMGIEIEVKEENINNDTDTGDEVKLEKVNSDTDTADEDILINPKVEIKVEPGDIVVHTGIVVDEDRENINLSPNNNFDKNISFIGAYYSKRPDEIILTENCNQYNDNAYSTNEQNQDPLSLENYNGKNSYQYNRCEQFFLKEKVELYADNIPYQRDQYEDMVLPNGQKLYQCKQCSKIYLNMEYLTNHMKTHTQEKEHVAIPNGKKLYQCKHCNKVFLNIEYLTTHMKTHTQEKESVAIHIGKKLHQCKQCDKVFPNIEFLTKHLKTHYQEKPCKCSQCGVICANDDILTFHIRLYHGDMSWQCNRCDKAFPSVYDRKIHMNEVHNKIAVKPISKNIPLKASESVKGPLPNSLNTPMKTVYLPNLKLFVPDVYDSNVSLNILDPSILNQTDTDFSNGKVRNVKKVDLTTPKDSVKIKSAILDKSISKNIVKQKPYKYKSNQTSSTKQLILANVDSTEVYNTSINKNVLQQDDNNISYTKELKVETVDRFTPKHKTDFVKQSRYYIKIKNQNCIPKIKCQQHKEDMIKGAEITFYNSKLESNQNKEIRKSFKSYDDNLNKKYKIKGAKMVNNEPTYYNHELGENITDQKLYEYMMTKYTVKKVQVCIESSRFNSYYQFPKDLIDSDIS